MKAPALLRRLAPATSLLLPVLLSPLPARSALSVLATRPAACSSRQQGPSGHYLLRKADALAAAGQLDAAALAYNQATSAFRRSQDAAGQQQALTRLAAVEEKRADQLLASAATAPQRLAPAAAAGGPPPGADVAPLPGKMVAGRPQGLFFMTRYIIAFHSLEKATFYFMPNGQVYHNPTEFSAASLSRLPATDRGTLSVSGRQMTVKWADGQASKSEIEDPHANSFTWDMGLFVGMGPFANTRQLVGTFEGGNSVSSSSGSAAAVSGLTFRADGSYSGSSASSFSTNTGSNDVRVGGSGGAAGRWALAGWTLTLTDNTGRTVRGVAYPIETDEKTGVVRRFYFNNVAYKRL